MNSVDLVRKVFEHTSTRRLPRGELWLGTELLQKAGLEDNLQGHVSLIKRLGQDILSLPISNDASNTTSGYRSFSLKELEEASRMGEIFLAAVISGPFQRLAEKKGLMKILIGWKRTRDELTSEYEKAQAEVDSLIKRCLDLSVDAIIIADDLAGEDAPFVDPRELQTIFASFYTQVVSAIHKARSYALFHSCGNITRLIPQLVSYGFDGLAAVQHRANNLISIREKYGSKLILMAGIESEILEAGERPVSGLKEYERLLRYLAAGGGFILCSSSGLYSGNSLERIQELYRIADEL